MILFYTILITTALFFAGSRARLTQPIWSRFPPRFARFMDCAMCSGAWYGAIVATTFVANGHRYPGIDTAYLSPAIAFFGSAVWTPITAALVQWSVEFLGEKAEET